jgi:hypothetical protein
MLSIEQSKKASRRRPPAFVLAAAPKNIRFSVRNLDSFEAKSLTPEIRFCVKKNFDARISVLRKKNFDAKFFSFPSQSLTPEFVGLFVKKRRHWNFSCLRRKLLGTNFELFRENFELFAKILSFSRNFEFSVKNMDTDTYLVFGCLIFGGLLGLSSGQSTDVWFLLIAEKNQERLLLSEAQP